MKYKYITENNLINKQNYMYSTFNGEEFLKSYFESRNIPKRKYTKESTCDVPYTYSKSYKDLLNVRMIMMANLDSESVPQLLDAYVKSFEVKKVLYSEYDENRRPVGEKYNDYDVYLLLGECLYLAYKKCKSTKYFSCMLKVNDTLISIAEKLSDSQYEDLSRIVNQELEIYRDLEQECIGKIL